MCLALDQSEETRLPINATATNSSRFDDRARWWATPVEEIKRFWDDDLRQANLREVRIHDLRLTFVSLLVSDGASLPLIGKILGHTQAQTTHRWAHVSDDPMRKSAEMVGALMEEAAASQAGLFSRDGDARNPSWPEAAISSTNRPDR